MTHQDGNLEPGRPELLPLDGTPVSLSDEPVRHYGQAICPGRVFGMLGQDLAQPYYPGKKVSHPCTY